MAAIVNGLADLINKQESPEARDALASRLQTLARAPDSPKARADMVKALEATQTASVVERALKAELSTESKDIFRQGASTNVDNNN